MSRRESRTRIRRPRLESVIEIPAMIITAVMMLHVTANALLRTFTDRPLSNTLEVVEYWYLPIIALLGFVAAQQRSQHTSADLLFTKFPHVTRRYVLAAGYLACAVVMAGFARYGWDEAVAARATERTAGVSSLVSWPVYYVVPLAFAVLTLQFLVASGRALRGHDDDARRAEAEDGVAEAEGYR